MIVYYELGSFLTKVAVATFELSFTAGALKMRPHPFVTSKVIRVTAIKHAIVGWNLVVCKMESCIKVPESSVATIFFAIERATF
jgi:hypothetical protein